MRDLFVTGLHISRKLSDIGFYAPTTFYWIDGVNPYVGRFISYDSALDVAKDKDCGVQPAYTFQQLWQVLPDEVTVDNIIYYRQLSGNNLNSSIEYRDEKGELFIMFDMRGANELANLAAEVTIYFIRNHLIKLPIKR